METLEKSVKKIYIYISISVYLSVYVSIYSKLKIKTPDVVNFEHIIYTPFSSVALVCYDQANVSWDIVKFTL